MGYYAGIDAVGDLIGHESLPSETETETEDHQMKGQLILANEHQMILISSSLHVYLQMALLCTSP